MAKENITPDPAACASASPEAAAPASATTSASTPSPASATASTPSPRRTSIPPPTDAPPIRIFVDPKSFIYLHGMILDYEETLMRQGFNFINPHSTKTCGCGSCFS